MISNALLTWSTTTSWLATVWNDWWCNSWIITNISNFFRNRLLFWNNQRYLYHIWPLVWRVLTSLLTSAMIGEKLITSNDFTVKTKCCSLNISFHNPSNYLILESAIGSSRSFFPSECNWWQLPFWNKLHIIICLVKQADIKINSGCPFQPAGSLYRTWYWLPTLMNLIYGRTSSPLWRGPCSLTHPQIVHTFAPWLLPPWRTNHHKTMLGRICIPPSSSWPFMFMIITSCQPITAVYITLFAILKLYNPPPCCK